MQDAFIDFARGRESFTLDEVQEVADGFGTPIINFEALATHNVRVSENKFVNKDYISFDIDAIDDEIGRFCKEDFISITDVNTFTSFPECAYNWNLFLLESYLFSYSKQFKLFHNRFNKTSVSGAIVSINFKSDDYCDIIAKALAKSNIKLEKQNEVLDYLFQNGYIARRKLDNLEKIINKAKLLKMN